MKRIAIILFAVMLGLSIGLPVARVGAATATPTRGITCKACDEDYVKPVVNFWLFYSGYCPDSIKLMREVLPAILSKYPSDQVTVYRYDLDKGPSEMMSALERWHNLPPGGLPAIFIDEHALVGLEPIQEKLEKLIDHYLERGGVALLYPNRVATLTATPTPTRTPTPAKSLAVVRIVFFWSQYCPHCHYVIENVLPPLQKKYGAQLEILMFELSQPENVQLFESTMHALRVPQSEWGVPFIIVGNQTLVGSVEVSQRLPILIEQYLAVGGVGLPPVPELVKRVGTPIPTATRAVTPTPPSTPTVRVVTETPRATTPVSVIATPAPTLVARAPNQPIVRAVMFWMRGCPRCEEIIARVLPPLQQKYGAQLDVQLIEVATTQDVDRLYQVATNFGVPKEQTGVPLLIIGTQALTAHQIPNELPRLIEKYLAAGGVDAPNLDARVKERHLLDVPFVGQIDLDQHSLAFSTLLIGLLDGFNPCSLWVISLLLALVVNTGSRAKTLLVGSTFLIVAAGIYAVIIIGLFSAFTFIGYALWIRIAVALIAGAMAAINIKDYFWFKRGVSLTIADEHKPKIYRDIRSILAPDKSALALVGATGAMALGITIIEMPCTAGLPILWTKLIAANNVGAVMFAFLLGLYLLMYVLDELLVFISAVVTLRATRLEEKQGRILKLIGGIVMLALALVLLVDPTLMDSVVNSMMVFGVAFLVALAILVVHRKILPRWGIVLGTEEL
ncbi:MAG: hypothetical protein N2559_00110 [Anaerolineae bacterium]|nr:hypothetical protein [Anaerolineae bacterium]